MKLSIIITAYNTRGLVRQLLRGLYRYKPQCEFEVIVVDNHSQDGTKALVSQDFPEVTYSELPANRGLATANNVGVRKARGEYLLVLNPDIAVFENQIDILLDFMERHPRAAMVGPRLLNPDKTLQYSAMQFPKWYTPILRRTPLGRLPAAKKHLLSYIMKSWDHATEKKIDWVLGAAMLIRASSLKEIGLQDEHFFLYFEDVDWCKRAWDASWEVWYCPQSSFVHYHRRESAEYPGVRGIINPITKIHMQSWLYYFKKHQHSHA